MLRQFVRGDEVGRPAAAFSTSLALSRPLTLELPTPRWSRRRTRFKIVNLAANHRANDVLVVVDAAPQLVQVVGRETGCSQQAHVEGAFLLWTSRSRGVDTRERPRLCVSERRRVAFSLHRLH